MDYNPSMANSVDKKLGLPVVQAFTETDNVVQFFCSHKPTMAHLK